MWSILPVCSRFGASYSFPSSLSDYIFLSLLNSVSLLWFCVSGGLLLMVFFNVFFWYFCKWQDGLFPRVSSIFTASFISIVLTVILKKLSNWSICNICSLLLAIDQCLAGVDNLFCTICIWAVFFTVVNTPQVNAICITMMVYNIITPICREKTFPRINQAIVLSLLSLMVAISSILSVCT